MHDNVTLQELELRLETQKQTLLARDESIKKLLEMLQNKGMGEFVDSFDNIDFLLFIGEFSSGLPKFLLKEKFFKNIFPVRKSKFLIQTRLICSKHSACFDQNLIINFQKLFSCRLMKVKLPLSHNSTFDQISFAPVLKMHDSSDFPQAARQLTPCSV